MSERKRLEIEIARELERLSPDDMQRLAEDYARLRYPERFCHYDARALNLEGKSRPYCWPDAYVILADGRVDGVEATTTSDPRKIVKHLADDLKKASRRNPQLAGFVFVSGNPKIQLDAASVNGWKERFVTEAGLQPNSVDLVFGGRLAQELVRPEFLHTRIEILGLREHPFRFELVRTGSAPDYTEAKFIPSAKDYEEERVHRPKVADTVLQHLDREGIALVRGVGASGKTVLAWQLAQETSAKHGSSAYYADLARIGLLTTEVANDLAEDLCRRGGSRVLFVLDNIHLDERLARQLVLAWRDLAPAQRPHLLLVGRELRSRQGNSPIKGIEIPIVSLKARQDEVRGVYVRLVSHEVSFDCIRDPPKDALDQWVKTFGGNPHSPDTTTDLIAFSAAVLKRMSSLLKGREWTLTVEDAVDEVREAYLKKIKEPGEIRNLMRLCALAELEIQLHEQALADSYDHFDISSRRLGLVFREEVGAAEQHVRYRLAHAALGDLLLKAAPEKYQVELPQEQLAVALAAPFSGFVMAGRLLAIEKPDRAAEILAKLMEKPTRLLELGSLQYWLFALQRVQRLDASLLAGIGAMLKDPANRKRLVDNAFETPLHFLRDFLAYVKTELKSVFNSLAEVLKDPANRKRLAVNALHTPLGDFKTFLAYAEKTEELKDVFKTLAGALKDPANRKRVVDNALDTPLDLLKTFLAYTEKTEELKDVFKTLAEALKDPANRKRLADNALDAPLDLLKTFLAYTEKTEELKDVFKTLAEALKDPANRKRLADNALDAPLDLLKDFLAYAEKTTELKPVFDTMTEALKDPDKRKDPTNNRDRLVERVLCSPLGNLKTFLDYVETTQELKSVFDTLAEALNNPNQRKDPINNRDRLVERALDTPLGALQFFLAYVKRSRRHSVYRRVFRDHREKTIELKALFKAMTDALKDPSNCDRLVQRAIDSPLGELQSFLIYAKTELKPVFDTLILELNKPENKRVLVGRFTKSPLSALVNILKADMAQDLWKAVLIDVDEEAWMINRLRLDAETTEAFVEFRGLAAKYGRPELAAAPALNLVRRADSRKWHQSVIGSHHFSHVLRCAKGVASPAELYRFVERIGTPEWVDAMYQNAPARGLAGSLLALADALPQEMRQSFLRDSLDGRIRIEIDASASNKPEGWSVALSLLGAAALLGLRIASVKATWPSDAVLAAILEQWRPDPTRSTIVHLQVQLWRGLREMARLKNELVKVHAEHGEEILMLWRASNDGEAGQLLPPHIRQANEEMIQWLRASKAAGWKLAKMPQ